MQSATVDMQLGQAALPFGRSLLACKPTLWRSPFLTGQRDLFLFGTTAGGRHISELQQQLSVAASTCTIPGGPFGAPAISHLEPWWPAAVQSTDLWTGATLPDFTDQQWAPPPHTSDVNSEDVRSVSWWVDPSRLFCSLTLNPRTFGANPAGKSS